MKPMYQMMAVAAVAVAASGPAHGATSQELYQAVSGGGKQTAVFFQGANRPAQQMSCDGLVADAIPSYEGPDGKPSGNTLSICSSDYGVCLADPGVDGTVDISMSYGSTNPDSDFQTAVDTAHSCISDVLAERAEAEAARAAAAAKEAEQANPAQ